MKIMNKFSVVMLSILFTSTLAGCELIPTQDENQAAVGVIDTSNAKVVSTEDTTQLLKDGFFNLGEIDSASYNVSVKGDITAPEGSAKLDLSLSGESDGKDKTKPKFTLKFNGSGDIKSDDVNANLDAEAELRLNESAAYLTLSKLDGLDTIKDMDAESIAMVNEYIGKWWKFNIPAGTFNDIESFTPKSDESEMTEFEKDMKKLAEDTNFFSEVKLASSKGDTDVYDLTIDMDATKAYLVESAKRASLENSGTELSEEDVKKLQEEIDKQFELLEIRSLQVSYNTKVNVVSGLVVSLKASFEGGIEFDGDVSIGLANFNESVEIVEPADAELFDPSTLGLGGAPEMNYDMDMDYDMNTDDTDIDMDFDNIEM